MAAWAYILECGDGGYCYGSTSDLPRLLRQHRAGQVRATKARLPIRLVYFEQFETPGQARQRERGFENGRTRRKTVLNLIRTFPAERLAPFA